MRILVCIKRVPAPGARIVLGDDGQAIDTRLLSFTISPHEECAVEAGVQLAEETGGTVTVLTLGPAEAEEQLRSSLAVGASAAVLIPTDGEDWDPISTASAIASAVEEVESDGLFDLLLFGNESADSGGYQVGIRVAYALGRPVVSGIKGIETGDGSLRLRRDTAGGAEIYELPTPAVVAVKEGINLPRYPTLRGRLGAKKVPLVRIERERIGSGQRMVRLTTPAAEVAETVMLDDAAAVADVIDAIQKAAS